MFAWETGIQSQVKSYQRLQKWYLVSSCLTLSVIMYGSRIKWSNSSYWKGSLRFIIDYGRRLYFFVYVYISERTIFSILFCYGHHFILIILAKYKPSRVIHSWYAAAISRRIKSFSSLLVSSLYLNTWVLGYPQRKNSQRYGAGIGSQDIIASWGEHPRVIYQRSVLAMMAVKIAWLLLLTLTINSGCLKSFGSFFRIIYIYIYMEYKEL